MYSQNNMDQLTAKELQYLSDQMTNEDLLVKQCMSATTQTQNVQFRQVCLQLASRHQQHCQQIVQLIQQHMYLAH